MSLFCMQICRLDRSLPVRAAWCRTRTRLHAWPLSSIYEADGLAQMEGINSRSVCHLVEEVPSSSSASLDSHSFWSGTLVEDAGMGLETSSLPVIVLADAGENEVQ